MNSREHLNEAIESLQETLIFQSRSPGPHHEAQLTTRRELSILLRTNKQLKEAHHHQREILRISNKLLGSNHPEVFMDKIQLGYTTLLTGNLAEAKKQFHRMFTERKQLFGTSHPDTLIAANYLGKTLTALGETKAATDLYFTITESTQALLGSNHRATQIAQANLAASLNAKGEPKKAQKHQSYTQGNQDQKKLQRDKKPHHFGHYSMRPAQSDWDLTRAQNLLIEVLNHQIGHLGINHNRTLQTKHQLALTLWSRGDALLAYNNRSRSIKERDRLAGRQPMDDLRRPSDLPMALKNAEKLKASTRIFEHLIYKGDFLSQIEDSPHYFNKTNYLFEISLNKWTLSLKEKPNIKLRRASLDTFSEAFDIRAKRRSESSLPQNVIHEHTLSGFHIACIYFLAQRIAILLKQPSRALQILEQYRSQHLFKLILWRHLQNIENISEDDKEELELIASNYDQATKEIASQHPYQDSALLSKKSSLQSRREYKRTQILADFIKNNPLPPSQTAEGIQQNIDQGTLMLSYSIDCHDGYIFVLGRDGLIDVHPIDVGAKKLELQVNRLRTIDTGLASEASRDELSRWLYNKLVAPAAERIANAERLVILPDGPLHYLNFAALTWPTDEDPRGWQYLIEQKPFHVVQSAAIYSELRSRRHHTEDREPRELTWIGVGDALYPLGAQETAEGGDQIASATHPTRELLRTATERGLWNGLAHLHHTGREVRTIADAFAPGHATALTEHDANEDRVRDALAEADVAHFAVHGLAHPEEPMDSFLALSLLDEGYKHNGLLQAWEIVDHLKLKADLVVLSACETAIGPEYRGEGLISISRAFQIAGARSVLASLWLVDDESTAELMIRFYKHWLGGKTKDEALRAAQLELIRGPVYVPGADGTLEARDFSAPRHWAAFQLIGDYR